MPNIKPDLLKDINAFCKLNELDVDDYVNGLLMKGHLAEKWGAVPDLPTAVTNEQPPPAQETAQQPALKPAQKKASDDNYEIYDF